MGFWFIPARLGGNENQILVDAGSLEEAVTQIKGFPNYIDNYNSLPLDERGHGYIELEEDFMKSINRNVERLPEKVFDCDKRVGENSFGECLCKKLEEHKDPVCVIYQPYFRFELPNDCPYIINKSTYVSFQEDI
jgi:hypothetical protein